jgi:hypothetical protein
MSLGIANFVHNMHYMIFALTGCQSSSSFPYEKQVHIIDFFVLLYYVKKGDMVKAP